MSRCTRKCFRQSVLDTYGMFCIEILEKSWIEICLQKIQIIRVKVVYRIGFEPGSFGFTLKFFEGRFGFLSLQGFQNMDVQNTLSKTFSNALWCPFKIVHSICFTKFMSFCSIHKHENYLKRALWFFTIVSNRKWTLVVKWIYDLESEVKLWRDIYA